MDFESFNPQSRTLMGPGPSDVHPRVLSAMARPTVGHLDPQFVGLMDEIKALLQYAMRTENKLTLPLSAPGSAGMECCFVNLIEPGDTAVVCVNGVFGTRMAENVERLGGKAVLVEDDWGRAVDLNKVEETLAAHPEARIVAAVHAETSTGARSDVSGICALARAHDCFSIIDTVTSLGGIEVDVDGWGADAVYSGSQKCLSCAPGISPVTFSEAARAHIGARKSKVSSWFLDMNLVMGYWGEGPTRAYHHTAPVNAMYGFHEALLILREEGLAEAWKRHQENHMALRAGIEAMGLELIVPEAERLPQLNAVAVPEGVDEAEIRRRLLEEFNLEIGAGLGALAGKVWRVGLMGYASRRENVFLFLSALEAILGTSNAPIARGVALEAAAQDYRSRD